MGRRPRRKSSDAVSVQLSLAAAPRVGAETVVAGVVDRVIFQAGADFAVFLVKPDEGEKVSVVARGCGVVATGVRVRVEGAWEDGRFGMQMAARIVTSETAPEAAVAAVFLRERVDGVGEWRSRQLLEQFGDELPSVLRKPAVLRDAPGIGPMLADRICERWGKLTKTDRADLELAGYGVTPGARSALLAQWGAGAAKKVRENPWLACKANGIGFARADVLAQQLGVSLDHPHRPRAAVVECCREATQREGSTRVNRRDILKWAASKNVDPALARAAIDEVLGADDPELVAIGRREVAHATYDRYEKQVAGYLAALAAGVTGGEPVVPPMNIELTKGQMAALVGLQQRRLGLLVGGPGTGKTTACKAICDAYAIRYPDVPQLLCSPTGRAARRLSEATGRPAQTIHRLLGYGVGGPGSWAHDRHNPLPKGLVLADEVSMLDVALAYRLLSAVGMGSTVLFVGDSDQLPSVGPGAVLRDIQERVPMYRLDQVMRQVEGNPVITECHRVNRGDLPRSGHNEQGRVVVDVVDGRDAQDLQDRTLKAVRWLRSQGQGMQDIQVLAFGKRSPAGVEALNVELAKEWIPGANPAHRLPAGALVLQTKNDYRSGTVNGQQGVIRSVVEDHGRQVGAWIAWDGNAEPLEHGQGKDRFAMHTVHLAFAQTVHKAQGSEWPWVVVVCHLSHGWPLMAREVLYTALSRAREGVVLLAETKALHRAVRHLAGNHRCTGLADYLSELAS